MAFRAGDIVSYLTLDTNKYIAGLNAAGAQAKVFASENATAAQKAAAAWNIFGTAGIAMTAGVTAPVVGGFVASTRAAIEFESAFAGVRKTVNASEPEYDKLNKQLLEMSRVVPKSVEGLAGIMEAGGQLGVPQAQLEKFTRTIADLSVATNLSEEAGASMLAQYANVMGMDISNIDRLGSTIVDLGNNTATTEADIVNMAQRLSGAGSILNLSNAQVMGLAATMASLGINAEAGGSAASRVLQRMLQDVRAGGDGLKVYAKTANMSEQAFAAAFGADPLEALISFIDGLALLNETGGDVYGVLEELNLSDIRITDTLLRMTGAQGQLEKNISRANEAWDENIALAKEAEQRYGTTESKIQLAKNSINGAAISIGNAFLPIVGDAADGVADLANKFADLDEEQQKSIITQAGVAAAIGPAMMLVKGLVGVLSGPGGLIALGLAGAAAIAGIGIAAAKDYDKSVLERTSELFGDIELSASEVQKIIAEGFGKPVIETSGLISASDAAKAAWDNFSGLHNQLSTKVYTFTVTGDTSSLAGLPGDVDSLIDAAEQSLDKGRERIMTSLNQLFDPGEGEEFKLSTSQWFSGLDGEMAAKGKELRDAVKEALAGDGNPDPEDVERVIRLQKELFDLVQKATSIDEQARDSAFVQRARAGGLSADSVLALEAERKKIEEEGRQAVDKVFEDAVYQAEKMRLSNYYDKNQYSSVDEQYNALMAQAREAYGQKEARVIQRGLNIADQAYYGETMDNYRGEIQRAKAWSDKTRGLTAAELSADQSLVNEGASLELSSDSARKFVENFKGIYDDLIKLQGIFNTEGIELPQQYKDMLQQYEQLESFANKDYLTAEGDYQATGRGVSLTQIEAEAGTKNANVYKESFDQTLSNAPVRDYELTPETDPANSKAAKDAADAAKGAIDAANQAAEEEEVHIWETLTPPPQLKKDLNQAGQDAGGALVDGANTGAEEEEVHIEDTLTGPVGNLPAAMGAIGAQAGRDLAAQARAQGPQVRAAGVHLGKQMEAGTKQGLGIASPAKSMINIVHNIRDTVVNTSKSIVAAVKGAGNTVGTAYSDSYNAGVINEILNPAAVTPAANPRVEETLARISGMGYIPGDVWTAMDPPKKGSGGGGGGGGSKAAPAPDYSAGINATLARVAQEQANLRAAINGYDAEYQRMLELTGSWRPYYDETELDQRVDAIEKKYKALIDAEQAGYDALSQEEQQARSQAHSKLMAQLQDNQREEISAIQQNYKLQQQLGADFLASISSSLSAAFAAKQEAARAEDYQDNVADLEKRIRQTRSARERRELTEELERLQRDEALRLEQQQLNDTLAGINALNKALGAGVIGLGDLLADPKLQTGTGGLGAVQGITAEQLESVLQAMADRQAAGGTQYSIDLSGAVIRDDSDIDRIIDGFEEQMRSIQRDMWR